MPKQELLATIRDRYRASSKKDKGRVLDEFIAVTGHHRKHGIRYEGRRVATQEPQPRMGALWAGATVWSPGRELRRIVSSVGDHHISRSQQHRLAALEPVRPAAPAHKPVAGKEAAAKDTASKASNPWTRTPTPTQLAR